MNDNLSILEYNKMIARRLTMLLDDEDETELKNLLAADFVSHFAGLPKPLNREQYLQFNRLAKVAFDDLHRTVEDMIAEDDKVTLRITARGTHTGNFQGMVATGILTKMSGIAIRRIIGERITEEWVVNDQLGLMHQLGVL